ERGRHPPDFGEERRTAVDARVAAQGVPQLAQDAGAPLVERDVRTDRLSGDQLLRGAQATPQARQSGPGRPEADQDVRKLGIPIEERKRLAGVAVDAVFDSVSVATTFRETLAKQGIIFCAISEAIREHPELVRKYLGSVVPHNDNFFAALNSAVFTDGSFAYIPK